MSAHQTAQVLVSPSVSSSLQPIGKLVYWSSPRIIPCEKYKKLLEDLKTNQINVRPNLFVPNYHRLRRAVLGLEQAISKQPAGEGQKNAKNERSLYDVFLRREPKTNRGRWRVVVQRSGEENIYSIDLIIQITHDLDNPIEFVSGDYDLFPSSAGKHSKLGTRFMFRPTTDRNH